MQLEIAPQARPQTKQEMVYRALRNAIMHCTLQPGQRLIIDEIAQQLRVSHIPVREALQLLQSEGLVETIPHAGATVTAISRDSLLEVFTLMEGLEFVATRIAAARLAPERLRLLQTQLAEMDTILRTKQHDRWGDLNSAFHRTIARATGMPMLVEMTDRAFDQWDRIRRYFFNSVLSYRIEQAQQEHHAFVEALQERDYAQLEHLVKIHNQGALGAYTEHLAKLTT